MALTCVRFLQSLCNTSGDILTFISLSHSFAGTCNLSGSHPSSDWTAGIQSLRTPWQQYPRVMDVSDEFDSGMEPTDDLASFEVVNLSNPGLLDLCTDVDGHVQESKDKTKLKSKLISAWNNVRFGGV